MPTKPKIQDQTFLFTGTLTEFTRDEAEALVEAYGGKVLSGVSAKLNYLVVGEDAGSKLAKAKALKTVAIITEKEFLKMVPKAKTAPSKNTAAEKTKSVVTKASTKKVASETTIEEVKIGKQIWMAKNLDVAHFRNGDAIPEAKTNKEWLSAIKKKQPVWCAYNSSSESMKVFGKIYNCFAINDPRGLAPIGWSLPSLENWTELQDFIGLGSAKKLKASSGWDENGNGSKQSLFKALPGGMRCDDGSFGGKGFAGHWWCNGSKYFPGQLWIVSINNEDKEVGHSNPFDEEGHYVRCFKLIK